MEDERLGSGGVVALLLPVTAVALCCGGPLLIGLLISAGLTGAIVASALPAAGLVLTGVVLIAGGVWLLKRRAGLPQLHLADGGDARPGTRESRGEMSLLGPAFTVAVVQNRRSRSDVNP